ncbi:hypothetical protein PspLS_01819 [Pyricularia sp. CBS 133598]|nr:hypothetical protein PspLS_01819 [Pyricularia sp. CBS 133598]
MGSGCCSGGDCGGGRDTPDHTPPRHDGPSIDSREANHVNDRHDQEDKEVYCGTEGCESESQSSCNDAQKLVHGNAANDCNDETCCDADDASVAPSTKTVECCNTNEEHCDEKCIIAAAAAECEKTCDDDSAHDAASGHEHVHDQDGRHGTACNSHLAKAFEQYSAYLETARCICRSILERGLPAASCCNEQSQQTKLASSQKGKARNAKDKHGHTHVHAYGADGGAHAETTAHGLHQHSHHGMKHRNKAAKRTAVDHQRHNDPAIGQAKEADDESDCCGSEHDIHAQQPSVDKRGVSLISVRLGDKDVEKDAAGLEHISLVVDGMTCSGCGNKMERTLKASSAAVSSVRVNFVMGSAEFSLDPSHGIRADEIIRIVERGTGFRCARMSDGEQTLDVLVASVQASIAMSELQIPGVTQVVPVDKKQMRLTYDPAVVGARTLLEKLGELSSGLAPNDDPSVSSGRKRLYDQLIKTCIAAVLTIPVLVLAWGKESVHVEPLTSAAVSISLATLVQMVAVPDFYKPAISALVHSGSVEMDMLVVISITAAYVYSLVAFAFRVAGRPLETEEFFETSTLLITLVLLGRLVAAFARMRAVAAVSLRSLQASTALLVGQKGEAPEMEVDARLLQYGDRFKVLPHSTVPTDGIVTSGVSEVDKSMLTGEAVPVPKERHDTVVAGTVNGSGTLVVQLTRLPGKNTVTDIAKLVEEAANSKPKIQDVADRVAGWFVPVVTVTAILVTIVWIIVGIKVRSFPADRAVADAVTYAVAVLAISCPCALGLAVPMVLVVAGGIAARGGVVIKSAESTERARKVTDVVFDKTGTITESELEMTEDEYPLNDVVGEADAAAIARAVASGNKHPVSVAVAKHLEKHTAPDLTDVHVVPGFGIEAKYKGLVVRAGNPHWTQTESHSTVARLQDQGMTIFAVSLADTPIAFYSLRTRLRVDAVAVVKQLQHRGISVHLVSGDQKRAVEAVATQVGIPQSNVASQYTPAQKREYVAHLMAPSSQQNQEPKVVMFVGDGTNDAVAVAQADVGVQLTAAGVPGGSKGASAAASEVTRGAADVVLLSGLDGVLLLLDISRSASLRIKFNFAWSAVYNVLAILLASGALVAVRIPPAYAGLGEIVSVLPVIIAAATMFAAKKGYADGSA